MGVGKRKTPTSSPLPLGERVRGYRGRVLDCVQAIQQFFTSLLRRALHKSAFDPSRRSHAFAPQDEGLLLNHFLHPEEPCRSKAKLGVSKEQGNVYARVTRWGKRWDDQEVSCRERSRFRIPYPLTLSPKGRGKTVWKDRLILSTFLALSLTACESFRPPTETAAQIPHLQRINILVSDLEASRKFYTQLLGLTVEREGDLQAEGFSRKTFGMSAQDNASYSLMKSADQPRVIGLIQIQDRALDRDAIQSTGPQIVIRTDQMDAILSDLDEGQIMVPPSPLKNFDGTQIGREVAILDPDGYRILLFELNMK